MASPVYATRPVCWTLLIRVQGQTARDMLWNSSGWCPSELFLTPSGVPVRDVRVKLSLDELQGLAPELVVVILPAVGTHNETAPPIIESEFLQSNNRGCGSRIYGMSESARVLLVANLCSLPVQ